MYLATKWNYNVKWGWDRYDQRVFATLEEAEHYLTSCRNGELVEELTVKMHVRTSGEIYATIEVDVPPHGPFRCSCPTIVYRYITNQGDVGTIQWQAEGP